MLRFAALYLLLYPLIGVLIDGKLRTCRPGTIPDESDNRCCYPVFECGENMSVERCTEDYGNDTCKVCPSKKFMLFPTSSFDRRKCYFNPCHTKPEEVAIDSATCVCKPMNNLVHKPPETDILNNGLNCQFRAFICQPGFEPRLTEDECLPCKVGFFKTSSNNSLCRAWRNCTLMGYKVKTAGSSVQDEECDEDVPERPAGPTTPEAKPTTTSTSTISSTTISDAPLAPSHGEEKSNVGLIVGLTVALLVIFIFIILCCKYQPWIKIHKWYQRRQQNDLKFNRSAQNGNIEMHPASQPFLSGPQTMETILESNDFPPETPNRVNTNHSNGTPTRVNVPRSVLDMPDDERENDSTGQEKIDDCFRVVDENTKGSPQIGLKPESNGHIDCVPRAKRGPQANGPAKIHPEDHSSFGVQSKFDYHERMPKSEVEDDACVTGKTSVHPRVSERKNPPHLHIDIGASSTSNSGQCENPTMPREARDSHQGTSLEVQPSSGSNRDLMSSAGQADDTECRTPPEGAESSCQGPSETFGRSHQTPQKRVIQRVDQNTTQVKSQVGDPDHTIVKTGHNVHPQVRTMDPRGDIVDPRAENSSSRVPKVTADPDNTVVKDGPSVGPVKHQTQNENRQDNKSRPKFDKVDSKEEESIFMDIRDEADSGLTGESDSMINPELPSINNQCEVNEQTLAKLKDLPTTETPDNPGSDSPRPDDALDNPQGSTRPVLAPNMSNPMPAPDTRERQDYRRTVSLPAGPSLRDGRPTATVTPQRNLSCEETGRQPEEHSEASFHYSNGNPALHEVQASVSPLPSADFPRMREGGSVSGTDSSQPSS